MMLSSRSGFTIWLIIALSLFEYALAQSTTSSQFVPPFVPVPWQEDNHNETTQNTPESSYWLQNIYRQGSIPYAQYSRFNATNFNGTYPIFRNVKDYGAVGDGVTDDTAAIQMAINGTMDATSRCGEFCDSSTTTPALVYFPHGTYLLTGTITMMYYTQMVGDATNLPTLKGSKNFNSLGMLDADPYAIGGANWYTNQNNFYRQVRNFIFDMTDMPSAYANSNVGIHWQVAQATSLQNIVFNMVPNSNQSGVWMDNGSANFLGDLIFNGGGACLYVGNQQYTIRNITFNGCTTGIYQNWGWVMTYKNLQFNNCGIGLDMSNGGNIQVVGSVLMQDCSYYNTTIGVSTSWGNSTTPTAAGSLVLDNVDFSGVTEIAISGTNGSEVLNNGPHLVASFLQGQAYQSYFTNTSFGNGKYCLEPGAVGQRIQTEVPAPTRPSVLLDSEGKYFTRFRPQYEGEPVENFISVKNNSVANAVGDGVVDDTGAIQTLLNYYNNTGKILYFDHGAYVISDTIKVPTQIRMTGEIWPMFMVDGSSPTFIDPNNPQPVFQVGQPGDVGMVEMSELIFETLGPAPGAIIVEWNLAGETQGAAGMWDVHWRIGGSAGTQLQGDACLKQPFVSHGANSTCFGAFLLLHITSTASVYMENNWGWVADHELDMNPYIGQQIDIYNGRGVLIESTLGVWLVGTSFEHSQLYNYQVSNAENVYLGAIQSETAYMQDNPNSISAYPAIQAWNDPFFDQCTTATCYKTYGLRIVDSNRVFVYGAGLYSFFDNYDQGCLITENCQEYMIQLDNSSEIYLYNPQTKASANIIAIDGVAVLSNQGLQSSFCQGAVYFEEAELESPPTDSGFIGDMEDGTE